MCFVCGTTRQSRCFFVCATVIGIVLTTVYSLYSINYEIAVSRYSIGIARHTVPSCTNKEVEEARRERTVEVDGWQWILAVRSC